MRDIGCSFISRGFHGNLCCYCVDQINSNHVSVPDSVPRPPAPDRSGPSHRQVLASPSRMAVLELLRSRATPLGAGDVAQYVGLHQNTVRSHLDLFVYSGYAIRDSEAPSGPGRPRLVYEAQSNLRGPIKQADTCNGNAARNSVSSKFRAIANCKRSEVMTVVGAHMSRAKSAVCS